MRRKGEDTFAIKRRRMPYVAKIRREDPFRAADSREIESMVRRIAAAGETFSIAGWREDAGHRLFYFPTWAKARAMQHWIDRSGITQRPMPKLGLTAEEKAAQTQEALAWGLETGAARPILQAYRRARHNGDSDLTARNVAAEVALSLGRPTDKANLTVSVLIDSTKPKTTISSASNCRVQWHRPRGGSVHASLTSFCSTSPLILILSGRAGRGLGSSAASIPSAPSRVEITGTPAAIASRIFSLVPLPTRRGTITANAAS